MESKDRKRTREEEEEVSVEEKELEGTKKKAKTEDVEKSEANEKNEDEDEGDEAEEKEKGPLRELLRRTCWLPEVAPAYDVPAGSSEDDAKRLAIEAPEFRFDHRTDLTCFGGVRPWLRKDEEWPRCSNRDCTHQLQFFLQVDFRFAPDEARKQFVGDDTYEPFSKAVLLRFVPLPPADPTAGAPRAFSPSPRAPSPTPSTPTPVKKNLSLTGLDEKVEDSLAHGALMADVAANEDPAAQLAKRPHDDVARNTENTCFNGHFPFKRLVRWVPRDDWPDADEREDVVEELGQEDDDEEEYETYYSCKLGGWAPWVQSVSYASCPTCEAEMKNVVFNINEDNAIPFDWGDGGTGQILQCPTHLDALCFTWAV
ncbi:uncharacterized protein ACA1_094080 [Acanthamoeba castellanii str. Neff]|uniref:Uncharacterized protein n=1 Tax=Acanthamoeba castellanii (strain ATCC 30010 / Neff) TaxID=1257118 RepID=L8GKX5_ACACF|nr:uncharacterized protein ACA1_094080 [Acanthamoeba castellanii str. Neff]ELR12851.1 hypothetical protein ACA1_094080 [Acanthamoeba castellanii str. Neff]